MSAETTPSILFERDDLPALQTSSTTSSALPSSSLTQASSTLTQASSNQSNTAALPGLSTSTTLGGLPALPSLTQTTSASYTTPPIDIPSIKGNPFISSSNKPRGTVFIGVGSAVALILLLFGLYHLVKSLMASTLAKKTVNNEKRSYQRFADNAMYRDSNRSSTIFENLVVPGSRMSTFNKGAGSMAGSQFDANASFYDQVAPTTHQDLTNMFISPTKDVMAGKSRSLVDSQVNVSTFGLGKGGFNTAGNRSSQHFPSMYFNDTPSNSTVAVPNKTPERPKRRTVPSMYLEDLIDDNFLLDQQLKKGSP